MVLIQGTTHARSCGYVLAVFDRSKGAGADPCCWRLTVVALIHGSGLTRLLLLSSPLHTPIRRPQNLHHLMESLAASDNSRFEGRAVLRRAQMATLKPGSATVVLAALQPRCGKEVTSYGADDEEDVQAGAAAAGAAAEGSGAAARTFELHVSNLGDCGVRVVRDGQIVLATQPQQHDFNLPFQMSHPRLVPDTDIADSADKYVIEVQEGDGEFQGWPCAVLCCAVSATAPHILNPNLGAFPNPSTITTVIVAASDGVFDNMWDEQLLMVLGDALSGASVPSAPSVAPTRHRRSLSFRSFSFGRLNQAADVKVKSSASTANLSSAATAPPMRPTCSISARTGSLPNLHRDSSEDERSSVMASRSSDEGSSDTAAADADGSVSSSTSSSTSSGAVQAVITAAAGDAAQQCGFEPEAPAATAAELAQRAADALTRTAFRNAQNDSFRSPWSVAAGRQGLLARLFAHGGKMDDCTCVVALVKSAHTLAAAAAVATAGAS